MSIVIHPLSSSDVPEVLSLWRATEGIGLSGADGEEGVSRFLYRNPDLSLVAREDGGVVGAVLCGHDGRRGYLHHLAVAAAHRHRGIGRQLVLRCLESLWKLGIQKCHLFVFAQNAEAMGFWRSIGWHDRGDLYVMSHETRPGD